MGDILIFWLGMLSGIGLWCLATEWYKLNIKQGR